MKQTSPKISLILPCYGAEDFLPDIIGDLEKQTFQNFEILLVNDGGSRRQRDVMQELAKRNSKIRIIDQPNSGVSVARNTGIDAAQGDYIIMPDPDDRVKPYYVQSLYDCIVAANADIVIAGFEAKILPSNKTIDYTIQQNTTQTYSAKEIFLSKMNGYWTSSVCIKIYKTAFLLENKLYFRAGFTKSQDVMYWLDMCLKSNPSISLLADCGYIYMIRNANNAIARYHQNFLRQELDVIDTEKKVLELFGSDNSEQFAQKKRLVIGYKSCVHYLKKDNPMSFRQTCKTIKKEIVQNELIMQSWQAYHHTQNRNVMQKVYNFGMRLKSSFIIALGLNIVSRIQTIKTKLK